MPSDGCKGAPRQPGPAAIHNPRKALQLQLIRKTPEQTLAFFVAAVVSIGRFIFNLTLAIEDKHSL
jgi:hypothetical protein